MTGGDEHGTQVERVPQLVGSLESRVLPQLRQLEELGILTRGTQLPQAQTITAPTRPVPSAPDLISGDACAGDESLVAASVPGPPPA